MLHETLITQYLDEQQVEYHLLVQSKPTTTIEDTAQERGIDPAQMVKCILLRDMGGQLALACVPGDRSVDPKKVRSALKCRRMTCVSLNEVESITGFKIGTVAPLKLKSSLPILFDPSLLQQKIVTISSGHNMIGVAINCEALIKLCSPAIVPLCRVQD
ncbi:YbaK/EbsC family protein [Vibrio kagoshimensis]|uniref:Aminoacyl-tRNA deacylase n=1 Tax=Vibrio gallaecicus TaxID=552386 RepID=A0ABV4N797_9VIBR